MFFVINQCHSKATFYYKFKISSGLHESNANHVETASRTSETEAGCVAAHLHHNQYSVKLSFLL
jgi:hypothetical protein